ncbi:hypothetical protein [Aliivibrio fischeri]|uniref:hypothetical protein n=1 Tax=Aliivibrio fischeri TaxID=668 RepID=UPI0012D9FFBA|nr:hypothetical protein [Aliivibrio fischeri]MUJ20370.1 hypothetical protein [Aliivibrio fischeri]
MSETDLSFFSQSMLGILRTNEAYELLAVGDWTCGGCSLLASALDVVFEGQGKIVVFGRKTKEGIIPDHALYKINDYYLDGNGLYKSKLEVIESMKKDQGWDHAMKIDTTTYDEKDFLQCMESTNSLSKLLLQDIELVIH